MNKTIILAKHNENTDWASGYMHDIVIIEKGKDVPNVGREPASYLWYIIQNYNKLNGIYWFLQADPRDHCDIHKELADTTPEFRWIPTRGRTNLTTDMNGRPHDNVDIKAFLEDIGIEYTKPLISFNGCCLFKTTAELIRKKPKKFYQRVYTSVLKDRNAYAFERCVGLIFGDTNEV